MAVRLTSVNFAAVTVLTYEAGEHHLVEESVRELSDEVLGVRAAAAPAE